METKGHRTETASTEEKIIMPEIPKIPSQPIEPAGGLEAKKANETPTPEEMTLPKTSTQIRVSKTEKEETLKAIEKAAMPESTLKKILGIVKEK